MLIDDLSHMVCFMSQTVDINFYVPNHQGFVWYATVVLPASGFGYAWRGDGGRFGGLKGGADGLRVELRKFGDAVFGDAIIYRSLFFVCCPSRSLKLQSRA